MSSLNARPMSAEEQMEQTIKEVRMNLVMMRQHDLDLRNRLEDMRRTVQDLNIEVMSRLGDDRSRQGSLRQSKIKRPSSRKSSEIDVGVPSPSSGHSNPIISFTLTTPPCPRTVRKESEDALSDVDSRSESGGEDVPEHLSAVSPLLLDAVSIVSTVSEGARLGRSRHSMIVQPDSGVPLRRERSHSIELRSSPVSDPRKRASTMIFPSKRSLDNQESSSTPPAARKRFLKALKRSWFKKTSSSDSKKSRSSTDSKKSRPSIDEDKAQ